MPYTSSPNRSRTALSRRIAGAAAALVAAAAVGVAASADAADDTTLLEGVTGVSDVAAGAGKVFISAKDRIVVADGEGALTDAITGLSGAAGLALTPDGTRLYAALSGSNEVIQIDTSALTVTRRIDLTAYPSPTNLSLSGDRLWVGYGPTNSWSGGVLSLDLSAAAPQPVRIASGMSGPPLVAAAGTTVVAGETGISPADLYVYDVSTTPATLRGEIDGHTYFVGSLNDLAITPDGSMVISAAESPWVYNGYDTTTLTKVLFYGEEPTYTGDPQAVAVSPDGRFVAGARHSGYYYAMTGPDVALYDVATAAKGYTGDNPVGEIVRGTLAFSGTDLFGVVQERYNGQLYLWRMEGAALPRGTLTVTAPSAATVLEPLTLTGRLTLSDGAAPGAQQLEVTRTSPDGSSTTLSATTASDGTFTITDTPQVSGDVRYDVSWAGNATYLGSSASATVAVAARATALTLTGPATGEDGKRLRLSGTLTVDGKAPAQALTLAVSKTIWNNRHDGITEPLPVVTTDSQGGFRIVDSPTQGGRYVYTVSFDGSPVYAPAWASHEVAVSSPDSYITGEVEYTVYVGEPFRVTGGVRYDVGECQGPTTIHVTRRIANGTVDQRPDVTTNASCSFGFDDIVAAPGEVSYTLTWDGNSSHRGSSLTVTGTAQKQPSFIEATARDDTLLNGERATIDGKVAGNRTGSIGAKLTLTVNRIGPDGSSVKLRDVTTATDGTFSLRDTPPKVDASAYPQFQYDIYWAGNATYEGSNTSVLIHIVPAG